MQWLTVALLGVGFTDELWSGVAVVSAPSVEQLLGLDHGEYTLAVFALPTLLAALIEAGVSLLSHGLDRNRVLGIAHWTLAAALGLCALAPSAWVLGLGLAGAGAASGAACAAAEAQLVQKHPGRLDQIMARWMLFGAVGDVLSPALVALALALGGSYRAGFVIVFAVTLLQAVRFTRRASRPAPGRGKDRGPDSCPDGGQEADDDEPHVPLWQALKQSAGDVRLWLWLTGTALCTLLDEVVAALAALRLRTDLGATEAQATLCVSSFSIGVVLGALATEHAVTRWGWRRVLIVSSSACAVVLALVVTTRAIAPMTLALFVLGLCTAAQYPLLLARAYEAAPGRAAIVNAMSEVFVVVDVALPPLLGALADDWGLRLAMGCLLLQPLGVFTLVLVATRKPHAGAGRTEPPPSP